MKLQTVQKFFPDVKSVQDAKRPLNVEVTKHDVFASKRQRHKECAMAVACKRKFHSDGMIIARSVAYLIKGTKAIRFSVPGSVEREITAFDRGSAFEPGNYRLSVPNARMTQPKPSGRHENRGSSKPNHFRHITTGIRAVLGGKDAKV